MMRNSKQIQLVAPPASANSQYLADWMEIEAIRDVDRRCSVEDLLSALRTGGSIDAVDDLDPADDPGYERLQEIAIDAFAVVETRAQALAISNSYPFTLRGTSLAFDDSLVSSSYVFLVLSSYLDGSAGTCDTPYTALFEALSAAAIRNYFGGDATRAVTYQFGSPRREGQPSGFRDALQDLFKMLRDGGGVHERPVISRKNDDKLDIVAWIPSPDDRRGKLITFGQCATGKHWRDKVYELQPNAFCRAWIQDHPIVPPIRSFFFPHALSEDEWANIGISAGLLFDRIRITAFTATLPEKTADAIAQWNDSALARLQW